MEKIGYTLLGIAAIGWFLVLFIGPNLQLPVWAFVILGIGGIAILLVKAIRDRIKNKEDDYYSKNVNK